MMDVAAREPLVHGEPDQSEALADVMRKRGTDVAIPESGEVFEIQ